MYSRLCLVYALRWRVFFVCACVDAPMEGKKLLSIFRRIQVIIYYWWRIKNQEWDKRTRRNKEIGKYKQRITEKEKVKSKREKDI